MVTKELEDKLEQAAATGLDMSPGDEDARKALSAIRELGAQYTEAMCIIEKTKSVLKGIYRDGGPVWKDAVRLVKSDIDLALAILDGKIE